MRSLRKTRHCFITPWDLIFGPLSRHRKIYVHAHYWFDERSRKTECPSNHQNCKCFANETRTRARRAHGLLQRQHSTEQSVEKRESETGRSAWRVEVMLLELARTPTRLSHATRLHFARACCRPQGPIDVMYETMKRIRYSVARPVTSRLVIPGFPWPFNERAEALVMERWRAHADRMTLTTSKKQWGGDGENKRRTVNVENE